MSYTAPEMRCSKEARSGDLAALKLARKNGCLWNERTCTYAAYGGHLDILKWARENGCPWDERTCAYAAKGGYLDALKWVRKNGGPWDKWTCVYAALYGRWDVLVWAIENGCDYNTNLVFEKTQQLIALGCFIGKSCVVLGCQSEQQGTHLCGDHRILVCDILVDRVCGDVLRLIVEMTTAC